ncbi:hypothetical protein AB1L88_23400 [Tautonia sp. JC769]|uniref:hypothetical protein n=1 Tax=Tautonia sp. JC769 TaxID=3232135 RepID=UPI0034578405
MSIPDDENVYAAPGTPARRVASDPGGEPDLAFMARWERWRVLYNLVLVVEVMGIVIGMDRWQWMTEAEFCELLVLGALGANLCFCAGPVVEAYLRWLGVKGEMLGPLLFGLGMIVATVGTLMTLILYEKAAVVF